MMIVTLGEAACGVRYGYTTRASDEDTGVRFLRTTDIVSLPVDWNDVPFCEVAPSQEDLEKFGLKRGDIVISRMGTVGVSAFVDPPVDAVFASYLVRFRIDPQVAIPRYVAFVLRSQLWWEYVHARKGGAVQPNLNAKVMKEFSFPLPDLGEQQRILDVLSAIDDKIIANHTEAAVLAELLEVAMHDLLPEEEA